MSPKSILLTLGTAFVAFGEALKNTASDESGDTAVPAADNPTGEPAKRRGRPAGSTNAAPAAEKPAKPAGPSVEDLKAVAIPYIKKGGSAASEEVKKLITEHGGTCISDVPEENRAAFQQDLEALAI